MQCHCLYCRCTECESVAFVPVTAMIHSVFLFFPFSLFIFFSMNVALAEVKEKTHLALASVMWAEYKIPHTAVPVCFSANLQHFLLFQNWACLREIASHDTFYGGFVLCTNGD